MDHNHRLPTGEPPPRFRVVRLWHHPDIRTIRPENNAFFPPWRGAGVAYRLCGTCEQLDLEQLGYLPHRTSTSIVCVRLGEGLGGIRSSKHTCDLCGTIWRSLPTPMRDAAVKGRLDDAEVILRANRNVYHPVNSTVPMPVDASLATHEVRPESGPLCQVAIFVLPNGVANDSRSTSGATPRPDGWLWVYLREADARVLLSHELDGENHDTGDSPSSEPNNNASRTLATVVAGRVLAPPHADETMSMIRNWLRACLQEHHDCETNVFDSVRHYTPPPRLIEISADGTEARLIEAGEIDVPYLALSYCWGAQKVVTMTSYNYDAFQHRLPTEQLPRTIQQAIETTYRIGYHHLWVDSICIIQDNAEDWRRHTILMGYIYANAVLTIAATSAAGGSEGCFLPRHRATGGPQSLYDLEVRVPCVLSGRYLGPMFLAPGDESWFPWSGSLAKELKRSSWKDRAWVLQERFFSRRIVHFGSSQTHWECRKCVKSQMFPSHELYQDDIELDWQRLRDPEGGGVHARENAEEWWGRLVARYTRTQITYPADRLPALAGIIREAEEALGLSFVAGLCVETLPQSLLWTARANQESKSESPYWMGNPEEMPDFIYVLAVPSGVDKSQGGFNRRLTLGSRRPQDPPAASSWSWAHWEGPAIPFVARGDFRSHIENIRVLKRGDDQSHHRSVLFFSTKVRTVSLSPEKIPRQDAHDIYIKSFSWAFSPHEGAGWLFSDGVAHHAVLGPQELDEFVVLDDSTSVPTSLCLASVGSSVLARHGRLYRIKLSLAIERVKEPQLVEGENLPPYRYYRRLGIALRISEMSLKTTETDEKPRTLRQVVTGSRFQFAFGPLRRSSIGKIIALV